MDTGQEVDEMVIIFWALLISGILILGNIVMALDEYEDIDE